MAGTGPSTRSGPNAPNADVGVSFGVSKNPTISGLQPGPVEDGVPAMSKREARTVAAVSCVLLVLLAWHFAMTFLLLAPPNPISLRHAGLVETYMFPLFRQNWSLFAPNPIDEDQGLLVRAKLRPVAQGRPEVTNYVDITSSAIREAQARRLWPNRRARLTSGALQQLTFVDPTSERLLRNVDNPSSDSGTFDREPPLDRLRLPPATPEEARARADGRELIRRLAHVAAVQRWGNRVDAVQVRVARHVFPRFSRRTDRGIGDVAWYDLEWMPTPATE